MKKTGCFILSLLLLLGLFSTASAVSPVSSGEVEPMVNVSDETSAIKEPHLNAIYSLVL